MLKKCDVEIQFPETIVSSIRNYMAKQLWRGLACLLQPIGRRHLSDLWPGVDLGLGFQNVRGVMLDVQSPNRGVCCSR
ncbi:hypothetical protein CEXT_159001 [Caerostris extrusa]|uniref:Uncharacterized protein n=1 Tax=Caerostris extrusa TaxID=172846 RepID=A0AAV4XQ73_CAEEX|nr:hypothetical protein CEXT_159001 [Caerostris extrusa]